MNVILYLLIPTVFLVDHLAFALGWVPRPLTWLPELFAGLIMAVIIVRTASAKRRMLSARYFALFGFAAGAYAAGILANQVDPGAVFAGLRNYLRCLPLFLLPWVFSFDERQLKKHAAVVFVLLFAQVPLAVYQRFFAFADLKTGDVVTGTLTSPGLMSIIMTSGIAIVFAAYLKRRIIWRVLLVVAGAWTIPVAINETTASLFFIPLAFIVPALFIDSEHKGRYLVSAALIGSAFLAAFVAVYNTYYSRWEGGVQDIVLSGEAAQYLYKGATEESRTDRLLKQKEIGRVDAFVLPLKVLSEDPVALALGRGVGNVAPSFSTHFAGDYVEEYGALGSHFTALGFLLWETGIIGVLIVLVFLGMLFADARLLSRRDDRFGVLGLGWLAVLALITISLAYKNIMTHTALSFTFSLYAGMVAAKAAAMRGRAQAPERAPSAEARLALRPGLARRLP